MQISTARLVSLVAALIAAAGCSNQVAALKLSHAIRRGTPEACYGVARARHNDCKTDANICAGWSKHDADSDAFIYLPTGTCHRIVGGTLGTERKGSSS